LVVLPTGTGKTMIAAHLPDAIPLNGKRFLFLVHLDELAYQSAEKFKECNPHFKVGIEKAELHAPPDADVIIGSVQTLGRSGSRRIDCIDPDSIRICAIDEAHRAGQGKGQYVNVLRHLKMFKGDSDCRKDALLTAWTATPNRTDNVGLEVILDRIVYQRSILDMINEGWLANVAAYRVYTQSDISKVRTQAGDFLHKDLEESVNTPERNLLIVRKYQEFGAGAPALAFTVDIQHSHDLAEMFQQEGIDAQAISGNTPKTQCRTIIDSFKGGDLPVLISCMKLSEGFNAPIATIGLMGRPTKSQLLYTQQIGRVLRPWPPPEFDTTEWDGYRKPQATILDFADNCGKHELVNLGTLFGLRPTFDLKGKTVTKTLSDIEKLEAQHPSLDLRAGNDIDEIRAFIERVDLFRSPQIPALARKYSRFCWIEQGPDQYRLSLPDRKTLILKVNHLNQCELYRSEGMTRVLLEVLPDVANGFIAGDSLVPKDCIGAVMTTARWRKDEPNKKQARALYNLNRNLRNQFRSSEDLLDFMVRQYKKGVVQFTKGGVSQQISSLIEARR